jgi:hypothetical protein
MMVRYLWQGEWHAMLMTPSFPVNLPFRLTVAPTMDYWRVDEREPSFVPLKIVEFQRAIPQPPCLRGQLFLPRP